MVDVNLLPENLRGKEDKEKRAASKVPHVFDITFTNPPKEQALKRNKPKLSIFSKKRPAKKDIEVPKKEPKTILPQERPIRTREVIEFHIPKASTRKAKRKIGFVKEEAKEEKDETILEREFVRPDTAHQPFEKNRAYPEKVEVREIYPPEIKTNQVKKIKRKVGFFAWLKSFFGSKKDVSKKEEIVRASKIPLPPKPEIAPPKEEIKDIYPPKIKIEKLEEIPKVKLEKPAKTKKKRGFFAWLKSIFGLGKKQKKPKPEALKEIPLPPKPEIAPPKEEIKDIYPPKIKIEKLEEIPKVKLEKPAKTKKKRGFFAWLKSIFGSKELGQDALLKADKRDKRQKKENGDKDLKRRRLEINLISEEFIKHPELQINKKLLTLALVIIFSVSVVASLDVMIRIRRENLRQKIISVNQKITDLMGKINELEAKKAVIAELKNRLDQIESLLNEHIYWTNVFKTIEDNTIDEVQYINLAATKDGDLLLSAIGKDYGSVARQLVVFQRASFVEEVAISSASATKGELISDRQIITSVAFDINLTIAKDVFLIKFDQEE